MTARTVRAMTRPTSMQKRGYQTTPISLGDSRIVREIGRGGMGRVYEEVQESLQRRVALKVLPPSGLLREHGHERFQRESRAIAQLHHSNIVDVFGSGQEGGVSYFAMQLVDGQGLDGVIADCQSPIDNATPQDTLTASQSRVQLAAQIGRDLAEALQYAHGAGVLRRDVKPSNILLDQQGTAWLSDFGLAKLFSDDNDGTLTEQGDVLGTLTYMAPESLHGVTDAEHSIAKGSVESFKYFAENASGHVIVRLDDETVGRSVGFITEPRCPDSGLNHPPPERRLLFGIHSRRSASHDCVQGRVRACLESRNRPNGGTTHLQRWRHRSQTSTGARPVAHSGFRRTLRRLGLAQFHQTLADDETL